MEIINLNQKQLESAEKEAIASGVLYVHRMRKPFEYMGKPIETIRFDFDKLTGKDGLAIEAELQRVGKPAVAPVFSGEYLIRMASRASAPLLGTDAFELMSLSDYNRIRSAARSFLLKSES
ncbi:MAG: hypothetical protein RR482_08970 [Clostridia bacterium]